MHLSGNNAKTGKTEINKQDYCFMLLATLIGFFVFSYKTNPEFLGNDETEFFVDYLYFSYWDFLPNEFSFQGMLAWLEFNTEILFRGRHGPVPGIIVGPLYRLMALSGIPISKFTINLPISAISVAACCLLYFTLVKLEVKRMYAAIGTALMISSPIFAMNSRTVAGGFLIIQALNQILCLLAVLTLSETKKSKMFTGLILLIVTMSDVLFPIMIMASFIAYLYRESIRLNLSSGRKIIAYIRSDSNHFKAKEVWGPFVGMAFFTAFATLLSYHVKTFKAETMLFSAFERSGGFATNSFFKALDVYFDYLSFLFGEFFPVVLVAALICIPIVIKAHKYMHWATVFALSCSCCYFFVFYFMLPEWYVPQMFYQIYLVVPIIVLLVTVGSSVSQVSRYISVSVAGVFVLLLASSSMMSSAVILNTHSPFLADYDHNREIGFGRVVENKGTKAVGYIMSEVLESIVSNDSIEKVHLFVNDYDQSIKLFSGIRRLNLTYGNKIIEPISPQERNGFFDFPDTLQSNNFLVIYILTECENCESLQKNNFSKYEILDRGRKIADIFVTPQNVSFPQNLKPGRYELEVLESDFDRRYNNLIKNIFL